MEPIAYFVAGAFFFLGFLGIRAILNNRPPRKWYTPWHDFQDIKEERRTRKWK